MTDRIEAAAIELHEQSVEQADPVDAARAVIQAWLDAGDRVFTRCPSCAGSGEVPFFDSYGNRIKDVRCATCSGIGYRSVVLP